MLVLSRRPGQWIQIGDVRVEVLLVRGNVVRLGTVARPEVLVLRGPEHVHPDGTPKMRRRHGNDDGRPA